MSCPNLQRFAGSFAGNASMQDLPHLLGNPAFTFPSLVEFTVAGVDNLGPFLRRHPNLQVLRFMQSSANDALDGSSILPKLVRFAGEASDFISIFGHGTQPIEHLVVESDESSVHNLLRYLRSTKTIRYLSVEPSLLNIACSTFAFHWNTVLALIASSPGLTTFVCCLDYETSKTNVSFASKF